jgi:hypothetical protein
MISTPNSMISRCTQGFPAANPYRLPSRALSESYQLLYSMILLILYRLHEHALYSFASLNTPIIDNIDKVQPPGHYIRVKKKYPLRISRRMLNFYTRRKKTKREKTDRSPPAEKRLKQQIREIVLDLSPA